MNELPALLKRRIGSEGPMNIAEYMAMCLTHPQYGYYVSRDPLGLKGDFITAPEISQMFGELIGLCLAQSWIDIGQPKRAVLAELGPGRGTLMADALRSTKALPGFHDALEICLLEASPELRSVQADTLSEYDIAWIPSLDALPEAPLLLIANEFLDALPARQFIRSAGGWRERVVGLDQIGELCFGLTDPLPLAELDARAPDAGEGDMIQVSAAANAMAHHIGAHVAAHGGVAIIVDYGDWHLRGDTLQAVQAHQKVSPLHMPGESDLTVHVDFAALSDALPGTAQATGQTTQGEFLERLGITHRAQVIARAIGGDALENHVAAHRRLTHPDEMGSLFKVLAITPKGAPIPPGFST